MARTREEIRSIVHINTGRDPSSSSTTLARFNYLCDDALKLAIQRHPFRDASASTSFLVSEDDTQESIAAITNLVHIISVSLIDAASDQYRPLVMKDWVWWDRNVTNEADNTKGWPIYGLRDGTVIRFDRPVERALTMTVRSTSEQTFSADSTACPVSILDIFVAQYVTAMIFMSIENRESYEFWKSLALGPQFDVGKIGGTLASAVSADKLDLSEEMKAELYPTYVDKGVAIRNMTTSHGDYGNTRTWY